MLESVNGILALSPQNVTLHALCLKKSARLKTEGETQLVRDQGAVTPRRGRRRACGNGATVPTISTGRKMRSAAWKTRAIPQPGRASYNMVMMDDLQTVLGFGAGAISKYIRPGADPVRAANHKFPMSILPTVRK